MEKIECSSLGMKHYLCFVGFAMASRRYFKGTDEFILKHIDTMLQTRYKDMFSSNRSIRNKAEKSYKVAKKKMFDQHKKFGKTIQNMCDIFDNDLNGVEREEYMSLMINEFADNLFVVKK